MRTWRLLDLGEQEPHKAQLFCEAVAQALEIGLVKNTIILVQPSAPYVCLGYHQSYVDEINESYCKSRGLPVIVRQQGGGTTYLDKNQIFYQIVAESTEPILQGGVADRIRNVVSPTLYLYRKLGLRAKIEGSDVTVGSRKISGNAAGAMDGVHIIVGNVLIKTDHWSMCHVLKSPNPTFRALLCRSIRRHVTSISNELHYKPSIHMLKALLLEGFQKQFNLILTRDEARKEESHFFEDVLKRHEQELKERMKAESHEARLRRVKVMSNRYVASANVDPDWAVILRKEFRQLSVTLSHRDRNLVSREYILKDSPSPDKVCAEILHRIPEKIASRTESLASAIMSILEDVKSS